jgi:hypothetical protein
MPKWKAPRLPSGRQRGTLLLACVGSALLVLFALAAASSAAGSPRPRLAVEVVNLSTGLPLRHGESLPPLTQFQVRVRTLNSVDCAGQFVVTAVGATPAPPSVLVQAVPFIVGPAVGSNVATGFALDGGLENLWKVSASCNGAAPRSHDFDFFEFGVGSP